MYHRDVSGGLYLRAGSDLQLGQPECQTRPAHCSGSDSGARSGDVREGRGGEHRPAELRLVPLLDAGGDGDWKYYAKNEPSLSQDAVKQFAGRGVRAVGSDTIACDTSVITGEEMDSYAHYMCWLPSHILIIEELRNLDQLPEECYFVATSLKIKNGSGSPIRSFALVPSQT